MRPGCWQHIRPGRSASALPPGVVVVVEVVDAYNFKTICEKALNQVRANKTGSPRDQNSFFSCLLHCCFLTNRKLGFLSKLPLRLTPRWRFAPGYEDRAMETNCER